MKKLKILYYFPYPNSLNAGRTIYYGYKHAFEDLEHEFYALSAHDDYEEVLSQVKPDIFIWSIGNIQNFKQKTIIINKFRAKGLKVVVQIPFWNYELGLLRINESQSLKNNKELVSMIKNGEVGDYFYNSCEDYDERMSGFEKATGYKHITIPLAADKRIIYNAPFDEKFKADISYVGTLLPEKKVFFKKLISSLSSKHTIKVYGQDWTHYDKVVGFVHKVGMYYNLPLLKDLRKQRLELTDEGKIYKSSKISVNIHEEYQRKFGGECNERTFKIPLGGGFEIVDSVQCIRKYFKADEEIIIASSSDDYKEKLDYFLKNPEKKEKIICAGRERVLKEHTYEARANTILDLYNKGRK